MSEHVLLITTRTKEDLKNLDKVIGIFETVAKAFGIRVNSEKTDILNKFIETFVAERGIQTTKATHISADNDTKQSKVRTPRGIVNRQMGLRVLKMLDEGVPYSAMPDKLGISIGSVYRAVKMARKGKTNSRYVITPEFCDSVRKLRDEGLTINQIASKVKSSHSTVSRALSSSAVPQHRA